MTSKSTLKAIFLDRDGVINVDTNYVHKIEEFKFCDGIFELCQEFQKQGFIFIVITNQSGIDRGYYTHEQFNTLTTWMIEEFKKRDIQITEVYYCPDTPEKATEFRKPNPGMILKAKKEHNINLNESWLIGDKISDIDAGLNASIPNLVLITEHESIHKTHNERYHKVRSLSDIKKIITEGKNG
jgi:D-glycero-D-manno-heptose 1,7-bisphosphate phosphatase